MTILSKPPTGVRVLHKERRIVYVAPHNDEARPRETAGTGFVVDDRRSDPEVQLGLRI